MGLQTAALASLARCPLAGLQVTLLGLPAPLDQAAAGGAQPLRLATTLAGLLQQAAGLVGAAVPEVRRSRCY